MSVTALLHLPACAKRRPIRVPERGGTKVPPRSGTYLRPWAFGVLRIRLRVILWIHRDQIPILPLEQERDRGGVLAVRGELHGSLQRIETIRVQLLNELSIVNRVYLVD